MIKSVVVITIFGAPSMTNKGKKRIAQWIARQGEFVEKYGHDFNKKAILRYRCSVK